MRKFSFQGILLRHIFTIRVSVGEKRFISLIDPHNTHLQVAINKNSSSEKFTINLRCELSRVSEERRPITPNEIIAPRSFVPSKTTKMRESGNSTECPAPVAEIVSPRPTTLNDKGCSAIEFQYAEVVKQ